MTERRREVRPDSKEDVWDFEGTRRHHIRLGLRLTPAERLRWLEETVDEMRRLQGLPDRAGRSRELRDSPTTSEILLSTSDRKMPISTIIGIERRLRGGETGEG